MGIKYQQFTQGLFYNIFHIFDVLSTLVNILLWEWRWLLSSCHKMKHIHKARMFLFDFSYFIPRIAVSICHFLLWNINFVFMSNIFFSQFNVDRANAEEFYEVYKGVVTEYPVSIHTAFKLHTCTIVVSLNCYFYLSKYKDHLIFCKDLEEKE